MTDTPITVVKTTPAPGRCQEDGISTLHCVTAVEESDDHPGWCVSTACQCGYLQQRHAYFSIVREADCSGD